MTESHFYQDTRPAQKVFLADLGFLGDTLHLFPALRVLRDAYPDAELHVMVADHVKDLLQLTPWVDRVWGYPRFPTSPPWYRLIPLVRALRREKFDVVVNVTSSNRSSFLSFFTGAPRRLGRVPEHSGGPLWPFLFTTKIDLPFDSTPVFEQRWLFLKKAGYPTGAEPRWDITIPERESQSIENLLGSHDPFVHVSPFTTLDYKELTPQALAAVLNGVNALQPGLKLVLSCAPNDREKTKLADLLPLLDFQPWKIFAGTLTPLQACALIGRARMHLGGDSGGVHMAVMQDVPCVIWFREHHPLSCWAPRGPRNTLVFGTQTPGGFLQANPEAILAAAEKTLSANY